MHERLNDYSPITPEQIEELYTKTRDWLEANGEYSESENCFRMEQGDVPLTDRAPTWRYAISGQVIKELLPGVAAQLEVGECIRLSYDLPYVDCSALASEDPRMAPQTYLLVLHNEASPAENTGFSMSPGGLSEGDDTWIAEKDASERTTPELKAMQAIDTETVDSHDLFLNNVLKATKSHEVEERLGLHQVLQADAVALSVLVDNLDAIKAAQDNLATD